MNPEITPAAVALVLLLAVLFVVDLARLRKNRPMLVLQALVFAGGALLIVYPEIARRLARVVGIGRGVDFVMYPLVIWLVRESLLTRRRRREDEARFTELVRAIALERAHPLGAQRVAPSPSPDRAA
jgi:hypothetical protein